MRPKTENNRRNKTGSSPTRTRPSSPLRSDQTSSRSSTSSAALLDRGLVTEELAIFESLQISPEPNLNPRSFPHSVKQQCWEKAQRVKGRDPDRWRRDPLGNTVFRKLVGCPGCLCHDYDHIIPYSKFAEAIDEAWSKLKKSYASIPYEHGGKSTLENCQVLQATVNRSKGNRTEISKADLIQKSAYCRVSDRDMDLLELSAYGNVRRGQDSGGCNIQ